ncbi:MAG: glycoside hydrolase family protein [Roseateles sp.]
MNKTRTTIGALSLSAAALVGLALQEGYTDKAVQPLPGDKWTNGFGSTTNDAGQALKPGEAVTPPQALARKLRDVRNFEGKLQTCVKAELTQGEYDSLVSLAYNVGGDAVCNSTMVRLHNAGQHAEACAQFDRWTFYQGKDCRDPANRCSGLAKRRAAERAMCEGRTS